MKKRQKSMSFTSKGPTRRPMTLGTWLGLERARRCKEGLVGSRGSKEEEGGRSKQAKEWKTWKPEHGKHGLMTSVVWPNRTIGLGLATRALTQSHCAKTKTLNLYFATTRALRGCLWTGSRLCPLRVAKEVGVTSGIRPRVSQGLGSFEKSFKHFN